MSSLSFAAAHVKETQHLANHITSEVQTPTAQTTLPDCFTDHHAPPSVVSLFAEWTRAADKTDNGVTVINRQRQRYSTATVDRAAKWLKAHHLLFLVERGGGRGNGNRYFVRWSFIYETLSTRQNAVNHPEHAETLSSDNYARNRSLRALEEQLEKLNSGKHSETCNVSPVNSKIETFTAANRQQRQLRNERATRWAMAQLREATANEDALTAAAKNIRKALKGGQVWIGPEFNRLVEQLADDLRDLGGEEAWPETRWDMFSYTGYHTQQALAWLFDRRENEAQYQGRQREREEARRDPLPAGFSCKVYSGEGEEMATPPARCRRSTTRATYHRQRTVATQPLPSKSGYERIHEERATVAGDLSQMLQEEGAVHISDLIRREVATAGAVVNSGKRKRRQSGEAYQRAGNHHSGSKRATPKQAHKRGEHPVNVCEMMSGYLGKLRGGGNEMERNDKGN